MRSNQRQNITISVNTAALRKARVLAAQRSTSISGLLAEQLEKLVSAEDTYESAHRAAVDLMKHGLKLGGGPALSRDELHAR